jgi:hypothetical protein
MIAMSSPSFDDHAKVLGTRMLVLAWAQPRSADAIVGALA